MTRAESERRPSQPVKFYLAGSFGQRTEIEAMMERVRAGGGEITSDWTKHTPISPYVDHSEQAGVYAKEDIEGARDCDVFVLVPEEKGGTTQFAELGAALVSETVQKVFIVGPHNSRSLSFFHPKVERVGTIEEVFTQFLSSS